MKGISLTTSEASLPDLNYRHGYRLPPLDIDALLQFCQLVQKRSQQALKHSYRKLLFIRSIDLFDWLAYNHIQLKKSVVDEVHQEILERAGRARSRGKPDPEVNFHFGASFFPGKQQTLSLVHAERDEFIEIWEEQEGVREYMFWRNSARPPEFSETDWQQRERDWREVSARLSNQDQLAFTFTSESDLNLQDLKNDIGRFHHFIPDFEVRLERLAKKITEREKSHEFRFENRGDYMRFQEWLKSEAGEDYLYERKKKLAPLLEKNLRVDQLLEPYRFGGGSFKDPPQ